LASIIRFLHGNDDLYMYQGVVIIRYASMQAIRTK